MLPSSPSTNGRVLKSLEQPGGTEVPAAAHRTIHRTTAADRHDFAELRKRHEIPDTYDRDCIPRGVTPEKIMGLSVSPECPSPKLSRFLVPLNELAPGTFRTEGPFNEFVVLDNEVRFRRIICLSYQLDERARDESGRRQFRKESPSMVLHWDKADHGVLALAEDITKDLFPSVATCSRDGGSFFLKDEVMYLQHWVECKQDFVLAVREVFALEKKARKAPNDPVSATLNTLLKAWTRFRTVHDDNIEQAGEVLASFASAVAAQAAGRPLALQLSDVDAAETEVYAYRTAVMTRDDDSDEDTDAWLESTLPALRDMVLSVCDASCDGLVEGLVAMQLVSLVTHCYHVSAGAQEAERLARQCMAALPKSMELVVAIPTNSAWVCINAPPEASNMLLEALRGTGLMCDRDGILTEVCVDDGAAAVITVQKQGAVREENVVLLEPVLRALDRWTLTNAPRCKGKTAARTDCQNRTRHVTGFCHHHRSQAQPAAP